MSDVGTWMPALSCNSMAGRDDLTSLPDNELMTRLKTAASGELMVGFEVLVGRYKNSIVSFLFRFVGDFRTAEDLAQETFLRVFKKIQDYNNSAKFSTWLYTIASNLAKDEFKRRSRHPARSLDWKGGQDTTRSVPQLKVLQECITLIVFTGVAFALFRSPLRWNIAVSYALIVGAVFFAFKF